MLYLDFRFLEVVLEGGEDGRMEKGNCASHMFLFCTAASNLSPSIFCQRNGISFGNLQIFRLKANVLQFYISKPFLHCLPLVECESLVWFRFWHYMRKFPEPKYHVAKLCYFVIPCGGE